jgi:hypothetical protein
VSNFIFHFLFFVRAPLITGAELSRAISLKYTLSIELLQIFFCVLIQR